MPFQIFVLEVEASLKDRFEKLDEVAEYNQLKVLACHAETPRECRAALTEATGYGYNDLGRDTLGGGLCDLLSTGEAALVRPQITCGTHALALALMSNLRPGDEILSPVGKPYDTLEEVIGIRPSKGSLGRIWCYLSPRSICLPMAAFDFDGIRNAINDRTKLVTIQRSKGYQLPDRLYR